MKDKKVVVFDLDDTLLQEIDYLKSAYNEIATIVDSSNLNLANELFTLYERGENVFQFLVEQYHAYTIEDLLDLYRNHKPSMSLNKGSLELLNYCKQKGYILGLITDGRSITQRNKLIRTGIIDFFDKIVISEEFGSTKPSLANYTAFNEFEGEKYYIGDNVKKDFITPNELGWTTICIIDRGDNIHKQDFSLSLEYLPSKRVNAIFEIKELL